MKSGCDQPKAPGTLSLPDQKGTVISGRSRSWIGLMDW